MAAAFRPLRRMEPQLTPEQEDALWAALDAVDAADAAGDVHAYIDAAGVLLEMQLALGIVTREQLRAMSAPYLLDAIGVADKTPEGRALLQKLRDDGMELLNGDDYAERAGAALLVLSIDGVQGPRLAQVRAKKKAGRALVDKADWVDGLRSIETRTDLACMLLWQHAYGDAADADNNMPRVEDARESWRAARAARGEAQGMLEYMGQRVDRGDGKTYLSMRKPGGDE